MDRKYKGKFDIGWDNCVNNAGQKQIALGIAPKARSPAPKPNAIQDWESLTGERKRIVAHEF